MLKKLLKIYFSKLFLKYLGVPTVEQDVAWDLREMGLTRRGGEGDRGPCPPIRRAR
jgi:hypothetical protein